MHGAEGGSEKENPHELERLRWLYGELIRVEDHWTRQVRDQQARIATLLTVSGVLLGFLAGAGFLGKLLDDPERPWPVYVYVLSLVSICFALVMGIRALRPGIEIAKLPEWLNQEQIQKEAGSLSPEGLLRRLCESAAANQTEAKHAEHLRDRRRFMLRQFRFLMLALGFLVVALVGVSYTAHSRRLHRGVNLWCRPSTRLDQVESVEAALGVAQEPLAGLAEARDGVAGPARGTR
jgi:MFS family permease